MKIGEWEVRKYHFPQLGSIFDAQGGGRRVLFQGGVGRRRESHQDDCGVGGGKTALFFKSRKVPRNVSSNLLVIHGERNGRGRLSGPPGEEGES